MADVVLKRHCKLLSFFTIYIIVLINVNYLVIHTGGIKKNTLQICKDAFQVIIIIGVRVRSKFILFIECLC